MTMVRCKLEGSSLATTYPNPSQRSPKSSYKGDKLRHIEIDELSRHNRMRITHFAKSPSIEHGDCRGCSRDSRIPTPQALQTLAKALFGRQTAIKRLQQGDRSRHSTTEFVGAAKPNLRRSRLGLRQRSGPRRGGHNLIPRSRCLLRVPRPLLRPCRDQPWWPLHRLALRSGTPTAMGPRRAPGLVECQVAPHNSRASILIDRTLDLMFLSGVP